MAAWDDVGIPWAHPDGGDDIAPYDGHPELVPTPCVAKPKTFSWGKGTDPLSYACNLARLYTSHKPRTYKKNTPEFHAAMQLIASGLKNKIPSLYWPSVTTTKFSEKMSSMVKAHQAQQKKDVGITGKSCYVMRVLLLLSSRSVAFIYICYTRACANLSSTFPVFFKLR